MPMKISVKFASGLILILIGLLTVCFCDKIVYPGLSHLVGIENIVGKDNVVYRPDGSYYFTNPRRMVEWTLSVMVFGIFIIVIGIWISGIRLKSPPKDEDDASI
jgi:hypothetical protein